MIQTCKSCLFKVQVYIAGILSRCDAAFDLDSSSGCDFEWKASATPEVSNVSPSSGSSGTTITITGSNTVVNKLCYYLQLLIVILFQVR